MPASKQAPFAQVLEKFKKTMDETRAKKQPRLILIIMANTHDKTLNKGCVKDAKAVRKVFADICRHIHFDLCAIEISGSNYHRDNLFAAIDSIILHSEDDVTLFYYSGHGFSYQKDKGRKYPQVDLRAHNDQVRYNDIRFIEKHTENLAGLLSILRFKGARINIAIGDCCNTSIPFKRPADSEEDMAIVKHITPHPSKTLNQKLFNNPNNAVSILVSASQHGQPALTDLSTGSIFTHHFTRILSGIIANQPKGNAYLPWLKLLRQTSRQAFKDSRGYDTGGGKPGKQKAVFEVFIDKE